MVFFAEIIPRLLKFKWQNNISQILRLLLLLLLIILLLSNFNLINLREPLKHLLVGNFQIILGILIIGISELGVLQKVISSVKIPPGFIFSVSFLLIILIGSGLLMMPKAHYGPFIIHRRSVYLCQCSLCYRTGGCGYSNSIHYSGENHYHVTYSDRRSWHYDFHGILQFYFCYRLIISE